MRRRVDRHRRQRAGQGDEFVVLHRTAGGTWIELSSGSASWTWTASPDEETDEGRDDEPGEEVGVLAVLGEVGQPSRIQVACGERVVQVDSCEQHWVAVIVGVDPEAMNDVVVTVTRPGADTLC
jgi:hypothetical protein